MKTYEITNRISKQARNEIERIIYTHEKYKGSYFWNPSTSAGSRRSNERKFAANNPDVAFKKGKNRITASMSYEETTGNVYYSLTVKLNDEIKDIRLIKKLLK